MRPILLGILLGWVECALAAGDGGGNAAEGRHGDFFEVAGCSPQEVAAAMEDDALSAGCALEIVGVPMTAAGLNELIAGLREAAAKPEARTAVRWLVDLLEEDGRFDEALEVLGALPGPPSLRAVGLRWKAGRGEAAVAPEGDGWRARFWHDEVLWSAWIDLACGKHERAERQLEFLAASDGLSRHERLRAAALRLELARRAGKVAELLAGDQPEVVCAAWLRSLGRPDEAEALAARAETSTAGSLAMWVAAVGLTPALEAQIRAMLADLDLAVADRCLLLELAPSDPARLDWWLEMAGGHGESLERGCRLPLHQPGIQVPRYLSRMEALLNSHPGDMRLRLLAAELSAETDTAGRRRSHLLAAARAFKALPPGAPSPRSSYQDPAARALAVLAAAVSPRELDTMMEESAAFRALPAADRLRYRMAARLDQRVVETLKECDFKQPYPGNPGNRVAEYFREAGGRAEIPADAAGVLLAIMPDAVLAPGEGTVADRARLWSGSVAQWKVPAPRLAEAARDLLDRAKRAGPVAEAQVADGLAYGLREAAGLPPLPEVNARRCAEWAALLAMFGPPNGHTVAHQSANLAQSYSSWVLGLRPRPNRSQTANLLGFSPWWQNAMGAELAAVAGEETAAKAATLRMLFAESAPRTQVYDAMVAAGDLPCPDDKVRRMAQRRAETIMVDTAPPDPWVSLYLFMRRLSSPDGGGLPEPVALAWDRYPETLRSPVARAAWQVFGYGEPARQDALRKYLGSPLQKDAVPPEPSDSERFHTLARAGKADSDEALRLAREMALAFVGRPLSELRFDTTAAQALERAGKHGEMLAAVRARMEQDGKPEAEIRRALHRLHGQRATAAARELLERDPSDGPAMVDLLHEAADTEDRPAMIRWLAGMAHHAYEYFARYAAEENRDPGMRDLARHPLNMLRGTQVTALANALLAAPLAKPRTNARWPRADEPGQSWDRLFRLLLEHAPERLPEVLRWSGAVNLARPGELARIAAEMAKQGAAKEAGQLLAEAFFPPPPAADGPAFPPLVTDRLLGYESLPLSSLADAGLLGPLAEAAASAVPSRATAGTRVAVLLLADPREETWQRVAMPYLDGLEARDREQAMTALRGLLARRPEARDLYARLGQPRSAVSVASETLYTLPSKLAAAENPEDIATLWKRAVELLESKPERAMARRFLSSVAGRLTTAADDRVWREFLEHARRQSGFDRSECGMVSYIRLVTVPRQRRVGLLEWFAAMEPGRDTLRRTQEGWFDQLLAEQPPDHATLDFLHERMDWRPSGRHDAPAALVAYDLVKRRPEGASPAVVALLGADGACRVAWTLARRMPAADADPAALDFLDGAFDLEILAGGHPERLALVARVERAPAVGERVLRLPEEDARFVAVVARQRDGELVRLSAVERVADLRSGTPLALAPVGTDGSGLAVKSTPAGGPFGTDEVMSVTIPPGAKVELYRWPKPGPTLPWIAGWIMTSGPHCGLVLAASHGARQTPGERAEELKIAAGSFRNWRRVSSAWNREAPRTVTALALVASNHGDTPVVASLAGFVERPVQTVPQTTGLPVRPPPGAVRVGTLPGSVGDIGWDAADHSWAVISYDSLGVFEPDSGTFPGWKPLRGFGGDLFGQRDRWFAKTGKRIVCLTKDGAFHSYDLESETFADLGRLEGFDAEVFQITGWPVAPRLSPDGTLLATPGLRAGLRLTRIGPKMLQESRLLETGRILRIRFDAERGSLVACDARRRYTLPLTNWQTAPVRVEQLPPEETGWSDVSPLSFERTGWCGAPFHLRFVPKGNPSDQWTVDPATREVGIPSTGKMVIDSRAVPHFIGTGGVFRIDPTRLPGYAPLVPEQPTAANLPTEDGERLRFFIETKRTQRPECLELARRMVCGFVASGRARLDADERSAVIVLFNHQEWQATLDGIRRDLAREGADETAIRRALYRLHGGRRGLGLARTAPFAQALLELDPLDLDAVEDLLDHAGASRDRATAQTCLTRLAHHSFERFARWTSFPAAADFLHDLHPLGLFQNEHAAALADALLATPLAEPSADMTAPGSAKANWRGFLWVFARHAPDRMLRLCRWAGITAAGRAAEAVDLSLSTIRPAGEEQAVALLREAILGRAAGVLEELQASHVTSLARSGLLEKLVAASDAPEPGAERTWLAVRLAADPRVERWHELGVPVVRALPDDERRDFAGTLARLLTQLPDAAELVRVLRREAGVEEPATVKSLAEAITTTADAAEADAAGRVAALWQDLQAPLAAASPAERRNALASLASPLARAADDTLWRGFLAAAFACDGFATACAAWLGQRRDLPPGPRRLELLAWLAGEETSGSADGLTVAGDPSSPFVQPNTDAAGRVSGLSLVLGWLLAEDPPDAAALEAIRPWLAAAKSAGVPEQREDWTPRYPPLWRMYGYRTGDAEAACPQLSVARGDDGGCVVRWSLAGLLASGDSPLAGALPDFLDGRFDLEVLAGTHDDRMSRVARLENAAVRGSLAVGPVAGALRFRLLAREREGNIVRWSAPVGVARHDGMQPLVPTPPANARVVTRKTADGGPYGDAVEQEVVWEGSGAIELARWEWSDGALPGLVGWAEVGDGCDGLALEFRDAAGAEVATLSLIHSPDDLGAMRRWREITVAEKYMSAPVASEVVLMAGRSAGKGGGRVRLAGLAHRLQEVAPPPQGLVRIGRIPGGFAVFAADAGGGNRLGVGSEWGVGVFDFGTGIFSGWLDKPPTVERWPGWLGLAGSRLVSLHGSDTLRAVNLDTGQAVELGRIPGIKPQPPYAPDSRRILRLSPDGKVLALLDLGESLFAEPSFRLIALGEQSLGESRTLALPGVRDMRFVPDNNTLEALTPTHIFTLPMSEWRKATPKTRPGADGPKPPIEFPPGPWRTQRGGADLRVPAGGAGDILFVAVRPEDDRGRPFWQMTAARVVYVPHDGKLLLGPDDKVFFIGPTGSVFRVELEKLASQPPPAAPRP